MKRPQLRARVLANTAHLAKEEKALRFDTLLKSTGGSWSYEILLPSFFSALGVREPFAGILELDTPSLDSLKGAIDRASYTIDQKIACYEILNVVYPWARCHVDNAIRYQINPVKLGTLGSYKYWLDLIVEIDGVKTVICPEFRRQGELSWAGRKFVVSLATHSAVSSDAIISDSAVSLFRFHKPTKGDRTMQTVTGSHWREGIYSSEELEKMIVESALEWELACDRFYGTSRSSDPSEDIGPDDLFYKEP